MVSLRERSSDLGSNLLLVATTRTRSYEVVAFVEAYLGGSGANTLPERLRKQPSVGPYVASLAVDPEYRGRGVGAAVMRECEARLAGRGTITLEVEEDNIAALNLYKRLGYAVVSRDTKARKLEGDMFFGRSVGVTKLTLQKQQQQQQQQQQADEQSPRPVALQQSPSEEQQPATDKLLSSCRPLQALGRRSFFVLPPAAYFTGLSLSIVAAGTSRPAFR